MLQKILFNMIQNHSTHGSLKTKRHGWWIYPPTESLHRSTADHRDAWRLHHRRQRPFQVAVLGGVYQEIGDPEANVVLGAPASRGDPKWGTGFRSGGWLKFIPSEKERVNVSWDDGIPEIWKIWFKKTNHQPKM